MHNANRDMRMELRVTTAELTAIDERAASCNLSRSDYLRRCALDKRLPVSLPPVNAQTYVLLGRIGTLLNQAVRAIHKGDALGIPAEVIFQLGEQLRKTRQQLVGMDD